MIMTAPFARALTSVFETAASASAVSGMSFPPITPSGRGLSLYSLPPENSPMFHSHEQKPFGEPASLPSFLSTCHQPGAAPRAGFDSSVEHPSRNRASTSAAAPGKTDAAKATASGMLSDRII